LEIAKAANSPEAARVMNNLASTLGQIGEEKRSRELRREGLALAEELGNVSVAKYMRVSLPFIDYHEGVWDDALSALTSFISEAEAGGGSSQESTARELRARIRLARGDLEGALE